MLIVVEGGPEVLTECHLSVDSGVPAVICKDTGRAADILAYAFTKYSEIRAAS